MLINYVSRGKQFRFTSPPFEGGMPRVTGARWLFNTTYKYIDVDCQPPRLPTDVGRNPPLLKNGGELMLHSIPNLFPFPDFELIIIKDLNCDFR